MRWNRGLTEIQKFQIEQEKRNTWRKTFVWVPMLCQNQWVWLEFIYVKWTGDYYGWPRWTKHTRLPENVEAELKENKRMDAARRGPTVFKK